jgi:hypothetical protein
VQLSLLSSPRSRSWVRRIRRRFRRGGTLPHGGYLGRSASTVGRARGTRTPATATTGGYSFSPLLGPALEAHRVQIEYLRVSNCLGHGSYTVETGTRGKNGERREHAD